MVTEVMKCFGCQYLFVAGDKSSGLCPRCEYQAEQRSKWSPPEKEDEEPEEEWRECYGLLKAWGAYPVELPELPELESAGFPRVIDYTVCQSVGLTSLRKQVKHHLSKGWEPEGGASYAPPDERQHRVDGIFFQAMVKYESEADE